MSYDPSQQPGANPSAPPPPPPPGGYQQPEQPQGQPYQQQPQGYQGGYAPAPVAYGYGPQMPPVLQGRELSGWWLRVAATLLDSLFIVFTLFIGFFVNLFLMGREGEKNGMTLGKQVCNIRVIKEDGTPVTVGFAALREIVVRWLLFGIVGSFFLGLPGLLDVLWPLWDDKNQCLHDKMVSSYVVVG